MHTHFPLKLNHKHHNTVFNPFPLFVNKLLLLPRILYQVAIFYTVVIPQQSADILDQGYLVVPWNERNFVTESNFWILSTAPFRFCKDIAGETNQDKSRDVE